MLPTVPGSPPKSISTGSSAGTQTIPSLPPPVPKPKPRVKLQDGMATALSLDHWTVPASSQCECIENPELSVNFICPLPPRTRSHADGADAAAATAAATATAPHLPSAARFQEIFVDLCALHASSYDAASRHVLDSRFDSFLSSGEREFKRAVLDLIRSGTPEEEGEEGRATGSNAVRLSKSARGTSAYRRLEQMLRREMGLGTLDESSERRVRKMRGLRRRESERGKDRLVGSTSITSFESAEEIAEGGDTLSNSNVVESLHEENGKENLTLDPKAKALRELICQIRSDDGVFRQFSFLEEDVTIKTIKGLGILGMLKDPVLSASDLVDLLSNDSDEGSDPSPLPFTHEIQAFRRLQRPPGHVFVANGSVCDISCDAFLCPASISKKKGTVAGTIWRRWYEALRDNNAELMKLLRGTDGGSIGGRGRSGNRRRRSSSRSNSAGSDSEAEQSSSNGSGRNRGLFSSIPMKHYEEYDRVCSPKHWPWPEFWRKDEFEAALGGLFRIPFIIAGEVGIERSGKGSKQAVPSEEDHIQSLLETVRQFVQVSLEELRREQPRPRANRERYLLALPVVGTGFGQAGDITGQIVESMILCLSELVSAAEDVDCVIVCADLATFSHAQNVRRRMLNELSTKTFEPARFDVVEPLSSFRLFTPKMRSQASELAKLSTKGLLSLFIGAGVPMGAGLPSWRQLLLAIEDQFTSSGLPEERMLGKSVDPLLVGDWLNVLCKSREDRVGVKADIKERIAKFLRERSGHPSLLMYLLTSLPARSIVTQNYDGQIEKAFACRNVAERKGVAVVGDEAAAAESLSVIPYRPVRGAERWLLKMHGCVSEPESIVVTSDDYRTYENGRKKALGGLVQANLLTSHLLFVGFGLEDPNYRKILTEVRKAMGKGQ